jgi:hypothetical protein
LSVAAPDSSSIAKDTGNKECDEAGKEEKECGFGLLPIQGNVNKLKDWEQQTAYAP